MKIVVLNGSPKGDISVTMQYVAYLKKKFPQHEFSVLNIIPAIRQCKNEWKPFDEMMDEVKEAEGILWAFPLYVFLVHAQYKRFIEMISERGSEHLFQQKHTAVLTTSIHFYDHTAHNYMHGICDDLNMKYYGSYSAEMHDLFKKNEREKLLQFFAGFFTAITLDAYSAKVYPPLTGEHAEYLPQTVVNVVDTKEQRIVIVSDVGEAQQNLQRMIETLTKQFSRPPEVVNLHELTIKGGCLGCLHCGYDNQCIYDGKDGFKDFYNQKIKTADILIFAGTIRDRYFSSLWKTFFDRAFFNTHIPTLTGKQLAFVISGPFAQLPNLRQIFEAYSEWQGMNLVGIVTDENTDSEKIDHALHELARRSVESQTVGYVKPPTFLGIGGAKIFRDEIWGNLRFPFIADHQYYKSNGKYDFPQHDYKTRLRNMVMSWLIQIPVIRRKIYDELLITKMVEPYKRVLDESE